MPLPAIFGAIGGAVASNAGNIWNAYTTLKGWQRDDWNTQRTWNREDAMTQAMWNREDTAVQRRVADLKAAGLSPVLAAGSAASTSAPISSSPVQNSSKANPIGNPVEAYLATAQQRADISHTKADEDLIKLKQGSEEANKEFIIGNTKKVNADAIGQTMRNAWINRDMMSQLGLRDKQMSRLNADTLRIGQQTELLRAQTAYEQTSMDKLLTDIDNAKILRDINILDRQWYEQSKIADIYNKYMSGNLVKSAFGLGGLLQLGLQNAFNELKHGAHTHDKWYFPHE